MSGKSTKLIVGIILLVAAILLYAFGGFNYIVALIIGVIGVAMIVLSFTGGSGEVDISEMESPETPEMPEKKKSPNPSKSKGLEDLKSNFPKPDEKAKSEEPSMGEEKNE